MDKDRVKGAANDAAGRVKRQVGEWTGDTGAQVEGSMQQVKGKAQKAWGAVKDAARNTRTDVGKEHEKEHVEREEHTHSDQNRSTRG